MLFIEINLNEIGEQEVELWNFVNKRNEWGCVKIVVLSGFLISALITGVRSTYSSF